MSIFVRFDDIVRDDHFSYSIRNERKIETFSLVVSDVWTPVYYAKPHTAASELRRIQKFKKKKKEKRTPPSSK